jgi:hypothetical protein
MKNRLEIFRIKKIVSLSMMKKPHKKLVYSPSLGKAIARAARRSRVGRYHIISSVSDGGRWGVVLDGSTKPIKVFSTKEAAIDFAKNYEARSTKYLGEVIVHNKNGLIEGKISF